jgi:hypothetical protein
MAEPDFVTAPVERDCHGGVICPASCKTCLVRKAYPTGTRVGSAVRRWESKSILFVSEREKVHAGLDNCCLVMFTMQNWPRVECRNGLQGGDLYFVSLRIIRYQLFPYKLHLPLLKQRRIKEVRSPDQC